MATHVVTISDPSVAKCEITDYSPADWKVKRELTLDFHLGREVEANQANIGDFFEVYPYPSKRVLRPKWPWGKIREVERYYVLKNKKYYLCSQGSTEGFLPLFEPFEFTNLAEYVDLAEAVAKADELYLVSNQKESLPVYSTQDLLEERFKSLGKAKRPPKEKP